VADWVSCVRGHQPSSDPQTGPPSLNGGGHSRLSAGERRRVARASRGDVAAFGQLVQEHSGLVRGIAVRMLGREEAQDACQEVWIRAWRHIRDFRGDCSFATWLRRITVNTCLSLRKRESRREERAFDGGVPDLPEPSGGDADPEAAALGSERKREMGVFLGGVREEHRVALVLRHVEGLSYAEIAEVLGVPSGTAKGWASRGRAAMLVALS
jgi:RNA polymerase sigma-70 factor, ECF subfamily